MCALRNNRRGASSTVVSDTGSISAVSTVPNIASHLLTLRNLPHVDDPAWYAHSCFDRYWNTYKSAISWYRQHSTVYEEIYGRTSTMTRIRPSTVHQHSVPHHVRHTSKRYKRRDHRKFRRCGSSTMEIDAEEKQASSASDICNQVDEISLDISDEMLDFFAKTHKHRKQRDADKQVEMEQMKTDKRVNIEQAKSQPRERTVEAPKERPGLKRSSEMKVIYGKGAPVIHGMETALQMTYDRSFDNKQPKYWPNMPFKCIFTNN